MIDLTVVPEALERAVKRARERHIIIPTFKQQKDPGGIPEADCIQAEKHRAVGHRSVESFSDHLA